MFKLMIASAIGITLYLVPFSIVAQNVSISDDGTPALPSAMLEIKVSNANKKGLLIPRMTTAQRNAIAAPAKGLLVYDSTIRTFWYHNGSAWTPIASGGYNPWSLNGINMHNNIPGGFVGIGLTNPKAKLHVGPNRTVVFGPDSLSSVGGGQFVWFSQKGALRFRSPYDLGIYPEPQPLNYGLIGTNSLAIGECIAGANSIAIGNASSANGSNSFAQGFGVSAIGSGSFARGAYAVAEGSNSYASGLNLIASGKNSFAHGEELLATAANCFVIGRGNDPIAGSNPDNWVAKDPIFIIGNGESQSPSNAFVILKNGVTGIGKNPVGDQASWGMIQVRNVGGKDHLTLIQNSTANRWGFAVPDAGAADLFMKYNGVAKGKFSNVNGAYTLVSDISMKKDISPMEPVLDQLLQVKAYQYHYLANESTDPLSHGFIAQEVQKLFPSFVSVAGYENGKELLGIDYTNFTVMAIKAIQEQQAIVQNQHLTISEQDDLIKSQNSIIQKQGAVIGEQQSLIDLLEKRLHVIEKRMKEK